MEEITIKTMADIFKVVNEENQERFFYDFCIFINQVHKVKKEAPELEIDAMVWTDDGKHEITGIAINKDRVIFKQSKTK
jgi:hypothetical protein